ncbi:MAG: exo-alpha-sialidase, partial [Kiritimatiellae bacterium]|nr:exo-alpha-sialidase [Kiritimatiellia bacterium]
MILSKYRFFGCAVAAAMVLCLAASADGILWRNGDNDVKVYRIPAICTAPDGKTIVAVCDARKWNMGDLNAAQPIQISCRLSTDNG